MDSVQALEHVPDHIDQRGLRLALGQALERRERLVRLLPRHPSGILDAALVDNLNRLGEILGFREPRLDELPQPRVAPEREDARRGEVTAREILPLRLAQLRLALREIQNVVDNLKRQAEMFAVLVHVHLDILAHLAEHRRGLARRRD